VHNVLPPRHSPRPPPLLKGSKRCCSLHSPNNDRFTFIALSPFPHALLPFPSLPSPSSTSNSQTLPNPSTVDCYTKHPQSKTPHGHAMESSLRRNTCASLMFRVNLSISMFPSDFVNIMVSLSVLVEDK